MPCCMLGRMFRLQSILKPHAPSDTVQLPVSLLDVHGIGKASMCKRSICLTESTLPACVCGCSSSVSLLFHVLRLGTHCTSYLCCYCCTAVLFNCTAGCTAAAASATVPPYCPPMLPLLPPLLYRRCRWRRTVRSTRVSEEVEGQPQPCA